MKTCKWLKQNIKKVWVTSCGNEQEFDGLSLDDASRPINFCRFCGGKVVETSIPKLCEDCPGRFCSRDCLQLANRKRAME